eukprot:2078797-Alexandrium_andersonii.AAC.1
MSAAISPQSSACKSQARRSKAFNAESESPCFANDSLILLCGGRCEHQPPRFRSRHKLAPGGTHAAAVFWSTWCGKGFF